MYDLSGIEKGTGPLRYSTGEIVTPESEARYKQMAESFRTDARALYDAERAKGTSSADIYDKLLALGDTQPQEYRDVIDWEAKLG
jgi:hypothetical protein